MDLVPEWAQAVPNADVHKPPARRGGPMGPPMSWQQLVATVQFFLDSFLGQVAVAFGGIEIFGWRPLQFLADWGQARINEASDNYAAAMAAQAMAGNAQVGADVANIEIALIKADLSADAVGSEALSDAFDGPEGPLDAAKWVLAYSGGAGSGSIGLNGTGNAVWFANGGAERGCKCRFVTALDSDNQSVSVYLEGVPQATGGLWPEIHLRLRANSADTTCVTAKIRNGQAEIGYEVSGAYTRLGDVVAIPMSGNQTYSLRAKTVGGTHTFTFLQDNVPKFDRTSPTGGPTQYGASYRYPGFYVLAGTGFAFPFFYQVGPPQLQVFTAADIA